MTKHINGLRKCPCGIYPELIPRTYKYMGRDVNYYKFFCPNCGRTSIYGSTVKEAKTNWNWNKCEK
jgi:predicted RNA-binding Zn-ribbon protein involved in translation (DUF1610 family)